ncbi:MAG: 3D domain-containing protein [Bacillota bacterium]
MAAQDQLDDQAVAAFFSLTGYQAGVPMEMTATAYDACIQCCGKTDRITKSGTRALPGHTIAVDPKVIPLGTQVYIETLGVFTAEDTGRAIKGRRIDIYMETHEQAFKFGIKNLKVYMLNDKVTEL